MSAEEPTPAPASASQPDSDLAFRWQGFFQRCVEPLFLLNRQRRILFVNQAWEQLTGISAQQARGLICTRRRVPQEARRESSIGCALAPPRETLQGQTRQVRRLLTLTGTAAQWWDIEFLPLLGTDGILGILGRIRPLPLVAPTASAPLPEKLVALRQGYVNQFSLANLDANTPGLQRVAEQVRLAAQSTVTVSLTGEEGSGKHFLARTIHQEGATREKSFVRLDCRCLAPTLVEAMLLGGAGIGSTRDVGTIYLRDPAALPREFQARVLDWLRDDERRPRCIVGSREGLDRAVETGRLLPELRCALGTLEIHVPPLRERIGDLPWLARRLLERARGFDARPVVGLTREAWDLVRPFRWTGNLRELYRVLFQSRLRAAGERIEAANLPAYLRLAARLEETPAAAPERPINLDEVLAEVEKRLILLALKRAQGNKSKAAEMLSIWRARLIRRVETLGITDPGA